MPVGRPYLFKGKKKKSKEEPTRIPQILGDKPKDRKKKKTATTSAQEAADRREAARKKKGPEKKDKYGSMGEDAFADREKGEGEGPSLAKTLTTIAASTRPGKTKIGAAISGGLSGAAIGATIGEAKDVAKRRAAKRKKKKNGGTE